MEPKDLHVLLEEHHPAGYAWALTCCGGDALRAEDLLQSVYLKILQGKAHYAKQAAFRTWLFAVIRNTAASDRRRNFFYGLLLLRYEQLLDHAPTPQDPPRSSSAQGSDDVLQRAMDKLSRRQQEVLHLVFFQNLTIEEAAQVMKVSVGSARTHYERGKARLRQSLGRTQTQSAHESRA
ncbi:MAG: sigma-70 family RNA polymerase sigma factor [Verrucomicrobiales bacterium]|nr:sigma-70 family RNA polymerase sigma factor [Verrucomicrobiales bacterium]